MKWLIRLYFNYINSIDWKAFFTMYGIFLVIGFIDELSFSKFFFVTTFFFILSLFIWLMAKLGVK